MISSRCCEILIWRHLKLSNKERFNIARASSGILMSSDIVVFSQCLKCEINSRRYRTSKKTASLTNCSWLNSNKPVLATTKQTIIPSISLTLSAHLTLSLFSQAQHDPSKHLKHSNVNQAGIRANWRCWSAGFFARESARVREGKLFFRTLGREKVYRMIYWLISGPRCQPLFLPAREHPTWIIVSYVLAGCLPTISQLRGEPSNIYFIVLKRAAIGCDMATK